MKMQWLERKNSLSKSPLARFLSFNIYLGLSLR